MKSNKSDHLDDVLKLIKTFAHGYLGVDVQTEGAAHGLEVIASELSALNKMIDANPVQKEGMAAPAGIHLLNELTASIPGVVYQYRVKGGQMEFTFVSQAALAILGATPEAIYKDSELPFLKVHPEDLGPLRAAMDESDIRGRKLVHTFRILMDGGGGRQVGE
jgi:PAS domain-containing protein